MGGYVQGAFKGVDLDVSKSIMSQMEETKVQAGTVIVSQGDPATHFYVLKKGQDYRELGESYLEEKQDKQRLAQRLLQRLEKLGVKVRVQEGQEAVA